MNDGALQIVLTKRKELYTRHDSKKGLLQADLS
jgi:hypothetical protein